MGKEVESVKEEKTQQDLQLVKLRNVVGQNQADIKENKTQLYSLQQDMKMMQGEFQTIKQDIGGIAT